MANAYGLIIVLFIVGGLIATLWGWSLIARARRTLRWPGTEGTVEVAESSSDTDDLLPHIEYSYTVDGKTYRRAVDFPAGTTPTQELSRSYVEKYPRGATVRVHYDPADPQTATLEPGPHGGDWLVLAFGLGAVLLGISMIFL